MRLFIAFVLSALLSLSGQAQERVRNVRLRVIDQSQLDVRYDLLNARPGDSVYLEVRSRLRGLLRISPEFVRGDIGKRIVAGSDRRIIWDALANGYSLNEEIQARILVKTGLPPAPPSPKATEPPVAAKPEANPLKPDVAVTKPPVSNPVEQPVQPAAQPPLRPDKPVAQSTEPVAPTPSTEPNYSRRTRYTGPAWALLSAVAPGIGNIFVQTPKPRIGFRPLIAAGCYGLIAYGLSERQKSRDDFAVYEGQKNATVAEPYYQTANDHYHRYWLATRGAIVVAAADVILTFFKGMRNNLEVRQRQAVTLVPGMQAGQPTAVFRYSF